MKLLKASAGSGKTYTLSKTYINLLLDSKEPYPYRHILAVTFTNKATAEMKSRILRDLAELSKTDSKSKALLIAILHDYSAFAITTIDKFFQQTLKAFSREIGQFADYKVELDRDSLIQESMDRLLDSITEDKKELISWVRSAIDSKFDSGESFKIDNNLYDIAKLLKSHKLKELLEDNDLSTEELFEKSKLLAIRKECRALIKSFETKVKPLGIKQKMGSKIMIDGNKTLIKKNPELKAIFEDSYSAYNTAYSIEKRLFALGLAGELYREFNTLLKEKNLLCLDESNYVLRDIINGSDAPFVYEKLGVRFDSFLLDEFQDTSNIQWTNFLPLLKESESKSGQNLVVGDIKQSIYRFRDSDWKLLGYKVKAEFPSSHEEVLDCNWRSTRNVVDFNNRFFGFASSEIGLSQIYSDVCQKPKASEEQPGYVRVDFCDDQKEAVYQSIQRAVASGAMYGDIAVLVRQNMEGSDIADYLIGKGVPVISDEALCISKSLIVKRLLSILSFYDKPDDKIGSYFASSLNISFAENYHSLVDLCESLIRELYANDASAFEGETLFIQAFMDELHNWSSQNGNNISAFLSHWAEKKRFIGSPETSASVRILTVHKSKGLEFPYLIFPYAEKVKCYKETNDWCTLSKCDSALPPEQFLPETCKSLFPVSLTSDSSHSYFANSYEAERGLQLVDNLNIFYVALTRASKCLHVIAAPVTKELKNALAKNTSPKYTNFSQILYTFVGARDSYEFGTIYDFYKMERKKTRSIADFAAAYPSIPIGDRLRPSSDALDFFSDHTADIPRRVGIALHKVLSGLETCMCDSLKATIEAAVDAQVSCGALESSRAPWAKKMLYERVCAHLDWFAPKSAIVLNERTIFSADGSEFRPDRVLIDEDKVVVIDFKFGGKRRQYASQVAGYMELYRQMGYINVCGIIWYVIDNEYEYI